MDIEINASGPYLNLVHARFVVFTASNMQNM